MSSDSHRESVTAQQPVEVGLIILAEKMVSAEIRQVVRAFVVIVCDVLLMAACGPRGPVENPDDYSAGDVFDTVYGSDDGPRIEDVALTTAVDSITFTPTGATGETFPPSTPRLYLCFLARGVTDGSRLEISWHRVDEDEPLSTTTERVEGDSRLTAEHIAAQPFYPGQHFVRISVDDEVIARVHFAIEDDGVIVSESLRQVQISGLGVYRSVDRRGRPQGRPLRRFDLGTRSLHCAFRIAKAPPGTRVTVAWLRDGSREALTELGAVSGDRSLSATIGGGETLPAGDYRVEVLLNGAPSARSNFVVGTPSNGAVLSELALTTSINPRSRRPATSPRTRFVGSESTIYLCLRYDGMTAGEGIVVRWIQDSSSDEPMAVSTVTTGRSGRLAASFAPDDDLPSGSYHADVVIGGEIIETVEFHIDP